jgi:hypothetical protein
MEANNAPGTSDGVAGPRILRPLCYLLDGVMGLTMIGVDDVLVTGNFGVFVFFGFRASRRGLSLDILSSSKVGR